MSGAGEPAGWYHPEGDPPGTERYWNGTAWEGEPRPAGGSIPMQGSSSAYSVGGGIAKGSTEEGGFFGALIDPDFKKFVTRRAIKVIWIVFMVVLALGSIIFLLGALSAGGSQAIVALLFILPIAFIYLVFMRMLLEFYVVQHDQAESLRRIEGLLERR